MSETFNLQEYMSKGVSLLVSDAVRATFKNPRETLFLAKFGRAAAAASQKRLNAEQKGEHVPPFLIASITSSCNLHCAGCYSRQNQACLDDEPVEQLSGDDWDKIFTEAEDLGVSFILLAGGEPLLRKDVIDAAAGHDKLLFPIFTNGYFIGEKYMDMFDKHRNLLPIISIEGDEAATDACRGDGVYQVVLQSMQSLKARDLIFGVSITVTTENMQQVYSREFIDNLVSLGCRAMIFVEYVPVSEETKRLAPSEPERKYAAQRIAVLRDEVPEMVFISFPGDEKETGGCVAAGRGFFHINSHGGAEPCPFSPYSDINVRDTSLREALNSRLFQALQSDGMLDDFHTGGCVLFEKRAQVEAFLAQNA